MYIISVNGPVLLGNTPLSEIKFMVLYGIIRPQLAN